MITNYAWGVLFIYAGIATLVKGRFTSVPILLDGEVKLVVGFGFIMTGIYVIYKTYKK